MSDCSLLIAGLSITKQIFYDPLNSKHTEFVDHRNILAEDKETPTSEAINFMLIDLK